MKILCVTHASRPFFESRCAFNFLGKRFPSSRLDSLPLMESFSGLDDNVPYSGSVTFWKIDENNGCNLSFMRQYSPGYKIQYATFFKDILLVYGSDRLEVLNNKFEVIKTIQGPHIVGGHTVNVDEDGYAWLTSAPGNMIMKVNLETEEVIEIAMPEKYGRGVAVGPDDDLREHYIPTDYQPTHVNSAYPYKDKIYVTLLIPGAVGSFDAKGRYQEIVSGFVGCHGGRIDYHTGELYLTDSAAGILWFFDPETSAITGRIRLESKWVHDAVQISDGVFAAGLSDKNVIQIFSRQSMEVVFEQSCEQFGQSVMFVNCCEINEILWGSLAHSEKSPEKCSYYSKNLIPPLSNKYFWEEETSYPVTLESVSEVHKVTCPEKMTYEYLVKGKEFDLPAGKYRFRGEVDCLRSGLTLGIVDVDRNKWLIQLSLDSAVSELHEQFLVLENTKVQVIISAYSSESANVVESNIRSISLSRVTMNADTRYDYFVKSLCIDYKKNTVKK